MAYILENNFELSISDLDVNFHSIFKLNDKGFLEPVPK